MESFIKNTDDSITDIQNDSKINQRVSEKTKELCLENKSLRNNLNNIINNSLPVKKLHHLYLSN
jgi:hypothetical protein